MPKHELWLKIALIDLKSAKTLLKSELYSSVMFHCQQSAEKSLKGFLVFKKQNIRKTHDLIWLMDFCAKFDIQINKLKLMLGTLNPLETKFRYPDDFSIPDEKEALEAIKFANRIYNFVLKKIKEPKTGQKNIFD
ncbi:MAG: HEPN domain-containing protein [bacterium]